MCKKSTVTIGYFHGFKISLFLLKLFIIRIITKEKIYIFNGTERVMDKILKK